MKSMRRFVASLVLTLAFMSTHAAAQGVPPVTLEPVLSNLSSPILVTNARDGSNRLFVVEQPGRIRVLQPNASTPSVFLDITARVLAGGERGLLGLAFHPQFKANRRLFVNYTRRPDGATVIAEYRVSATNPNVVETNETVLLVIPQPFENHNGGHVAFGADGYLYIGMGDGGSGNDPQNRAQNVDDLLGKMLRINVDQANGSTPYSSPSDNPYFGATAGRDEIYAVGLRNPFRFSFDRATGQLYAGDVGQGVREEIDIITRGGNYGWRVFEGTRCTGLGPAQCIAANYQAPVAEYDHTGGRCSVTGGYVYRGTRGVLPAGAYIYADFCTGEMFLLQGTAQSLLQDTNLNISSFGEDERGELYVVGLGGTVHRLNNSCSFSLRPESGFARASGETITTIVIGGSSECPWSAVSNSDFITVIGGANGSPSGTVTLSVAPNGSGVPRVGTVFIAGIIFTVTQPEITPDVPRIQFSQAAYEASEGAGHVNAVITRTGDNSLNASVKFETIDDPAAVPCATANGTAYARCDYSTTVDTIMFAQGESSKEIRIPLVDDAHVEGNETVRLRLSNVTNVAVLGEPTTATLTITDNDTTAGANPIFTTPLFVRIHYLDFLSREPEANEPWSAILNNCPNGNNNPLCDRITVSAAFFGAPEFRLKGLFVYNFYRVAFNRRPEYSEIIPDMRSVTGEIPADTFSRRASFPVFFMQRPEFKAMYDSLSNEAYVNALLDRYGLQQITAPDPQNPEGAARVKLTRAELTSRLGASGQQALTRAQVLRAIVESDEIVAVEYNGAFVAMQYYGYLRRTPEETGYQDWLRVINQDPQNVRIMVNGFMNSREYYLRFGQP
ncbi:MAG TPA: PQQ-dependent sugar dehydrogenase [Pyrinomonadaceae bacterium]|nr:PQQ-dependent sugar dehydrogenase [Pyrinomonadaceae bacterium]